MDPCGLIPRTCGSFELNDNVDIIFDELREVRTAEVLGSWIYVGSCQTLKIHGTILGVSLFSVQLVVRQNTIPNLAQISSLDVH